MKEKESRSTDNKKEVLRQEKDHAHQLLVTLQRGWSRNEWPKFIEDYEGSPDVAVVIELTRLYMHSLFRRELEKQPKIVIPSHWPTQ